MHTRSTGVPTGKTAHTGVSDFCSTLSKLNCAWEGRFSTAHEFAAAFKIHRRALHRRLKTGLVIIKGFKSYKTSPQNYCCTVCHSKTPLLMFSFMFFFFFFLLKSYFIVIPRSAYAQHVKQHQGRFLYHQRSPCCLSRR